MKKFSVILLVCFMASNMFAATQYLVGSVAGQEFDWNVGSTWTDGVVPANATTNELKLCGSMSDPCGNSYTVTVSTNVGNYISNKIDTARASTIRIVGDGYLGVGREMHIGDAGATGNGGELSDIGYVVQTGGTLALVTGSGSYTGKLQIGYKNGANGTYTISGGSLTGTVGRMYLGCSGPLAAGETNTGKLKVVGTAPNINLGNTMYVANDSETAVSSQGHGIIEFELSAAGAVSAIHVAKTVIDSQNTAEAVADLVVTLTGDAPAGDILLIENTGTSDVVGVFDSLNGGSAAEGAYVNLGGSVYQLTYKYIAGVDGIANDIAIVIPEPATIALLSLGLIAIRRKK